MISQSQHERRVQLLNICSAKAVLPLSRLKGTGQTPGASYTCPSGLSRPAAPHAGKGACCLRVTGVDKSTLTSPKERQRNQSQLAFSPATYTVQRWFPMGNLQGFLFASQETLTLTTLRGGKAISLGEEDTVSSNLNRSWLYSRIT